MMYCSGGLVEVALGGTCATVGGWVGPVAELAPADGMQRCVVRLRGLPFETLSRDIAPLLADFTLAPELAPRAVAEALLAAGRTLRTTSSAEEEVDDETLAAIAAAAGGDERLEDVLPHAGFVGNGPGAHLCRNIYISVKTDAIMFGKANGACRVYTWCLRKQSFPALPAALQGTRTWCWHPRQKRSARLQRWTGRK